MGADFPDRATLRDVLDLATRAPSTGNRQPWRWRVGPDALDLSADPGDRGPQSDSDRRDVLLGCGAALHHCTVALAAMGWRATVHRLPEASEPDHMARIEVTAQPADELDIVLASAIGRRQTDRRRFGPWPVPWGDVAMMGARAARAGVMLRQIEETPGLPDDGDDGSVTLALGTESDDAVSRLRAGEATSLVLLSATAKGLASCSVTDALATAHAREAVRAEVFGGSGYPQAMVRVGWALVTAESL